MKSALDRQQEKEPAMTRQQRHEQPDGELDMWQEEEKAMQKATKQIQEYRAECLALLQTDLLNDLTKRAYTKMWDDLLEQRNVEYMADHPRLLQETLDKAQEARDSFEGVLANAKREGSIGSVQEEELKQWYRDDQLLQYYRDVWIRDHLPSAMKKWRAIASERKSVLDRAQAMGVSACSAPLLRSLADTAFFSQSDAMRQALVERADAYLVALERERTGVFDEVENVLKLASKGSHAFLHPAKIGRWLQDILQADNPQSAFDAFREGDLVRWQELRMSYDALLQEFAREPQSPSFTLVPPDTFLQWSEAHCARYLAEGHYRLAQVHRGAGPEARELVQLKASIRTSIDIFDWVGAERGLADALLLAPHDEEVKHLRAYLTQTKTEQQKEDLLRLQKADSTEVLEQMRLCVSQLPEAVTTLYTGALEGGTDIFRNLMTSMRKREYAKERREDAEQTVQIEHMHYGKHDRIAVPSLMGDDAESLRVWRTAGDMESQQQTLSKLRQAGALQMDTAPSLEPDIEEGMHTHLVFDVNGRLLTLHHTLKELGFRYTRSGALQAS